MIWPGNIPHGGAFLFLRMEEPLATLDVFERLGYFSAKRLDNFEVSETGHFEYQDVFCECTETTFKDVVCAWSSGTWLYLCEQWTEILWEQIDFLKMIQGASSGSEAVSSRIPEAIDVIWFGFDGIEGEIIDLSISNNGSIVIELDHTYSMKLFLKNLKNTTYQTNKEPPKDEYDAHNILWSITKHMGVEHNLDHTTMEGYILDGMHRCMYSQVGYLRHL